MGIIRTDSEVAAAAMTGATTGGANAELAKIVHTKWRQVRERYGNGVRWRHVKGHSGHWWNNHVDAKAKIGGEGEIKSSRAAWKEAVEALERPEMMREEGVYTFELREHFELIIRREHVELHATSKVDPRSLQWRPPGAYPRVHETTKEEKEERRQTIRQLLARTTNGEEAGRIIGGSGRVPVTIHPAIREPSQARRGMERFERRIAGGRCIQRWRRGTRETSEVCAGFVNSFAIWCLYRINMIWGIHVRVFSESCEKTCMLHAHLHSPCSLVC